MHPKLATYLELMRLDRPVGTLLLLWPTLAALWLAADGWPPWYLVAVFSVGTFVMRSAGCVINDYADRGWDKDVERTRDRPLTAGRISEREALILFAALSLTGALLLVFLNPLTRALALVGFALAVIYPFMKRWTYLPQVVLGAAFSWAAVMAYASVLGHVPTEAWLFYVGSLLWIVAYDTQYAMVDRDDDLQVGIKSTAILFGAADRFMVGLLQASAVLTFSLLGDQLGFGLWYHLGLAVAAGLFVYQQYLMRDRSRPGCFKAFRNNTWVGFAYFAGVVLETTLSAAGTAP
ncbi:MAG: 4-hydroxybenzoate octaprenyltransferase [Gammaproteobacteria bacterium]|jgi:4-hydroxybenzoate polyprenyltransferase|nr:4-hydroxybenzoate octaprenyltransferase [Gammaproteobacteria bacterium]MBK79454.1 4-hydroxybenzoate octaprenyltransferase [Gammaproteobacteria bacterium]|tara:strand:- start:1162 stop:2037 length:876 start_codon:yes stop_codon:yes gene_type:complete